MINRTETQSSAPDWHGLASRILEGHRLTPAEGLAVLASPDPELLDLLAATYRVRRRYFGNRVQLYMLVNAKSGLCPEDCGYCAQSKVALGEDIDRYPMLGEERLLAGARRALECRATTYCIVASGRGPTERELDHVVRVVRRIKAATPLRICVCLGLLRPDQAERLKAAGVDRVNHNLNTSRAHYAAICTTHTFDDRLATLDAVQAAGISQCSGCIVGMGERPEDLVEVALTLRARGVESIPVNFLHNVPGTPLEHAEHLDPRSCLKALCLFRLANPEREIRIAGGREVHLRSLQAMGLYAANSLFVGDYLTTPGQQAEQDFQMIRDLGFEIAPADGPPEPRRVTA